MMEDLDRSDDAEIAWLGLTEFLEEKRKVARTEADGEEEQVESIIIAIFQRMLTQVTYRLKYISEAPSLCVIPSQHQHNKSHQNNRDKINISE